MTRKEANKYFPTTGLINKIFDDFESRRCINCIKQDTDNCPVISFDRDMEEEFSCNFWEVKVNETDNDKR